MDDKYIMLINLFAESKEDFITAKAVASNLGVSLRSVMRYLSVVNSLDNSESFRIISVKNKGFRLQVLNENNFQKFRKGLKDEQTFSDGQAKLLIDIMLTKADENQLENELSYSSSSINRMVNTLNTIMDNRRMNIVRKSNCYSVLGNEIQIRNFIQFLWASHGYSENFLPNELVVLHEYFAEYCNTCLFLKEKDIINYLFISLIRCRDRHYVQFSQIIRSIYENYIQQYKQVADLKKYCRDHYDIDLSADEQIFLMLVLCNTDRNVTRYNDMLNTIMPIISKILVQIDDKYKTDFGRDDELINAISCHVASSMDDYILLNKTDNTLIDQIRLNYTNEHCYALEMASYLYDMIGISISDDDIGYFTLHFATSDEKTNGTKWIPATILYKSSLTMARLLETHLNEQFKELKITGIYYADTSSEYSNTVGIVFIFEDELSGNGTVKVNPFFTADDLTRINKAILDRIGLKPFLKLCRDDNFYIMDSVKEKNELLDMVLNDLVHKKYLTAQDAANITSRERLSSTEIALNVAFPHCVIDESSFLAVIILRQPIYWQNNFVKLVLLMGLNRNDSDNKIAIKYLFNNLSDSDKVNRLLKAANYKEFIETLRG